MKIEHNRHYSKRKLAELKEKEKKKLIKKIVKKEVKND